jgi:hypothetical protein
MIVPELVQAAQQRAERAGFAMSCEPAVGRFLAVLAAAVPPGGRVLEMGTGAGVGTAWLAEGLAGRRDATITSVEVDSATAAVAQAGDWPPTVTLLVGDVLDLLVGLGGLRPDIRRRPGRQVVRLEPHDRGAASGWAVGGGRHVPSGLDERRASAPDG